MRIKDPGTLGVHQGDLLGDLEIKVHTIEQGNRKAHLGDLEIKVQTIEEGTRGARHVELGIQEVLIDNLGFLKVRSIEAGTPGVLRVV